jgi:capsular exopolysaccharide synthesis family protein
LKPKKITKDRSALGRYVDESPHGTEFRRLAKRVLDLCHPKGPLTLMVTSSMRGEGKTTIATNLAISLARKKEWRVLLVDADLRRPQIHILFGFSRRNGLAEILEDKLEITAAYRNTRVDNLTVITGGQYTRSPSKLFENNSIGDVMVKMKAAFDILVFDFPPTIPVSEPEMVGKAMDGVLYVFLAGKTPREVGQRGISILQKSEANILGVVVNDLSEVLPYHYRYKYYKYYTTKPELSSGRRIRP